MLAYNPKIIKYLIALLFFTNYSFFANAQSSISVKANTLSYQITEPQADLLKMKLSENGKLAFEPGIVLSFNAFANAKSALNISQFFIMDKASHLAGSTSLMVKFRLIKSYKHSFYVSLGSIVHYRKTWSDLEDYEDESIYNESSDWQYKFSWISGSLEYNYYINKMNDFSVSLLHIQAESIGLAIGFKHWINKKPSKKKRGCISCPSFH